MKPQALLAAVIFLLCACGLLCAATALSGPKQDPAAERGSATSAAPAPEGADKAPSEIPPSGDRRVIAYYFHGNFRCNKCRAMEAYAGEVINQDFAAELKAGRLEWKVVNVDEPSNAHFVRDYQLVTRSLVLAEILGGQQKKWKNLDKIWDLIGNELRYKSYVRTEIGDFLQGNRG